MARRGASAREKLLEAMSAAIYPPASELRRLFAAAIRDAAEAGVRTAYMEAVRLANTTHDSGPTYLPKFSEFGYKALTAAAVKSMRPRLTRARERKSR